MSNFKMQMVSVTKGNFVKNTPPNNLVLNKPPNFYFPKPKKEEQTAKTIDTESRKQDHEKMKWGEPTWFLFHTIAEKVKEENFTDIRLEIINNIVSICHNLPCPKCAKHAVEYMNKINFNNIQSKEDLKKMLFVFHNTVNQRKNYPLFEYSQLEEKYSKANTINIIQHFINLYNVKDFNVNMINANMHRDMTVSKLKAWFSKNIQYFNA
jgi:hypothetical protein